MFFLIIKIQNIIKKYKNPNCIKKLKRDKTAKIIHIFIKSNIPMWPPVVNYDSCHALSVSFAR